MRYGTPATSQDTEQMKQATSQTLHRIATLKIAAYGLSDTPQEYIEKCGEKSQRRMARIREASKRVEKGYIIDEIDNRIK